MPEPTPPNSRPGVAIVREAHTPLGFVELRRRLSIALQREVYEILIDGDLMMSSAVYESERALADLALAELTGDGLRVLIGGLGLGFTAQRVLEDPRVQSVTVVELLSPVVQWHVDRVLPWSEELLADRRLKVVHDDFFARLARGRGSHPSFDAIIVDIDDSPTDHWRSDHASFYTPAGLKNALANLRPGGAMALWSAVRPGQDFVTMIGALLDKPRVEQVRFLNPSLHEMEENYVVLGRRQAAAC